MPTGYTAAVADGKITTLREYAMQCARGMGACIMMRDDPWDAPIPERFEPQTSYHDKEIAKAQAALDEVRTLTAAECEVRAKAEFDTKTAERNRYFSEKDEQAARYDAMIAQAEAWDCRAEGLKGFMLEQLRIGRDGDCGGDRSWYPEPVLMSGNEWRLAMAKKAAKDLSYHSAERAKEVARTEERNSWLKALRDSLPAEPVAAE